MTVKSRSERPEVDVSVATMRQHGIPLNFVNASPETIIPWLDMWSTAKDANKFTRKSEKMLRGYARNFNDCLSKGVGLAISGPTGCGKSYFAAFLGILGLRRRNVVQFVTAEDMRKDMLDDGWVSSYWRMQDARLLILDGIGDEYNKSEFFRSELANLVKWRSENKRSTVLTTVLPHIDLTNRYGNQMRYAMADQMLPVVVPDLRMTPSNHDSAIETIMKKETN